jgi:hypothetical protein
MITQDHERLDFSTVPMSKGIQRPAFFVLAIGLFGIFFMGWFSYWTSGYGHMWQKNGASMNTLRMCLNQDEKTCPKGTTPQHTY